MSLSSTVDKRRRRTKAQIKQLQEQIYEVLASDRPQSVRHVFYHMTNPRLPEPVEKSERGYRHVQHRITQMRRAGTIPYGWITDATRRGWHVAMFDGPADFIRQMAGLYRADLWTHAEHYVEVWAESRSIAGVIEDLCKELAVSLYPAGGFSSITLAYEAAQEINHRTAYGEKPAEILYIGDYDPAGVLIDQALERELEEHFDPGVELHFHRLAITAEQIALHDLPTKPRKATDRRAQHIKETVEAEAMPARVLRGLLRQQIESFLPPHALQITKVAEESERGTLLDLADDMDDVA
jgi:hypothetical protein